MAPRRIRITAGSIAADGVLDDSATAGRIWDALPLAVAGETWGDEIYFDPGQSQARETPRDRGHGRPRLLAPRFGLLHLLRPHTREPRQRDPSSEPRQRFRQGRRRLDRLQEGALR